MSNGERIIKFFPDGRQLSVCPLLFDRARVMIGLAGSAFTDDEW